MNHKNTSKYIRFYRENGRLQAGTAKKTEVRHKVRTIMLLL
jgi:hypothetical protein